MSGRICAPGIPPKSKDEAKEHIAMIRKLLAHERQLATVEARESRERRENREKCLRHWEDVVLPNYDAEVQSRTTTQLWSKHGLPAEVRGEVWCRTIGNSQGITSRLYELCVKKSIRRERQLSQQHAETHSAINSVSPDSLQPPQSLSSTSQTTASQRGVDLMSVRERRGEDPTYFSPQLSKFESMLLINVDLPRTVITRGASSPAPSSSSSCGSPMSGSPLQSPRGRSSFSSAVDSAETPPFYGGKLAGASLSVPPPPPSHHSDACEEAQQGSEGGLAQSSLLISSMCDDTLMQRVRRALCAYVEYRPDVGYLQGMSYVAAMILLHVPRDEDGFIALANLLSKGHFKYFFSVHHQGIGAYMAAFDDTFRRSLPDLHGHFTRIGVHPQMYVMDWWMALFARALPYDVAVRCWDLYLLDEAYLFRVSLAILVYFSAQIHDDSALDEAMVFLTKLQRQPVDEHRFFSLVEDDAQYNGCSLQTIRDIMETWSKELEGFERPLEL